MIVVGGGVEDGVSHPLLLGGQGPLNFTLFSGRSRGVLVRRTKMLSLENWWYG